MLGLAECFELDIFNFMGLDQVFDGVRRVLQPRGEEWLDVLPVLLDGDNVVETLHLRLHFERLRN